jgi:hypothetical protein
MTREKYPLILNVSACFSIEALRWYAEIWRATDSVVVHRTPLYQTAKKAKEAGYAWVKAQVK